MIEKIISFSIKNKAIIGLFVFALICWGLYSISKLPIDAVPDNTNNQVQIISIAPVLAAQEVESFISSPIEVAMANIPDVVELRSISRLGLSVVTVVFDDKVDIYKARQLIGERLKDAESQIPEGLTKPELAPVSTGLGEVYQYILKVRPGLEKKYTPLELRTIQDWIVRRELMGTKGVADINSYGGFLKQYEIAINPHILKSTNVTLTEIFQALEKNNQNTGGAYIDKKPNAYFIRGIGLITSLDDIKKISVKNNTEGIPILLGDIAEIQFGSAPRYGAFVYDTNEAVGGVVMMLKGENSNQVVKNVKERLETIKTSLPDGITIEPYLDRTDLVDRSIHTVLENLILGGLIVIFVLVLLLGNLRAGLIVASVIPLSMLFAISLMNLFGVSGNLMSLGAIDFGLIVDGAVIIVESVVHRIKQSNDRYIGVDRLNSAQMDNEVFSSSKRMMNSATFGQIIILIVYFPILSLVGIEGKMFRPMAETVSFAIIGAIILSLTYVPMASALLLNKKLSTKTNISDKIMGFFYKIFDPLINISLRNKIKVVIISFLLLVFSVFLFNRLGGEFIPTLEEGDLASGVMTLQGGSLSNTVEKVIAANKILLENFPEVKHAACKVGAGEIPTDPTPMETGDYIITLKPKAEWTSAKTREELVEKMEEKLGVLAGVKFEFQQPIQMRFNELMSGSKQDVAIKIFGDNLDNLAINASKVEKIIKNVKGVEDINVEKVTGLPQIQIKYNRMKLAEYELTVEDVNNILKTAFAGSSAGTIYEEEKRFDMVVRLDKEFRKDLDDVKKLDIALPCGHLIQLEQLADIQIKEGPAQISREDAKRRITVGFNVRGRDVQSVIKEIQPKIDKINFPPGYYVTYGGQFQNLVEANKRLSIAVPAALLLIFVILMFTFHSLKQTLLIFTAVPLSAIGGVIALYLRDMNFSISAGVGFIALFGVAVLNGIVLIAEFNRLEKEKAMDDIYERVKRGIKARLRPVIMTAAVASLGFLPMAVSSSAGSEVQKPLATVVIGGLITSTFLTLIVLPVLYILFSGKRKFRFNLKKRNVIAFLAALHFMSVFSANNSFAQNPVKYFNLDQLISQAAQNNGMLKAARLQVESQKMIKRSAVDIEKTSVEFQYGQINSINNDDNISINQGFAFPTSYVSKSKLENANLKNAKNQLASNENELTKQVKSIYYQLVYLYSKKKLLLYQDSLLSDFAKVAGLKTKTGDANNLEKITAESQSIEVKNKLKETITDIEIYYLKLKNLISEKGNIRITDSVISKIDFNAAFDSSQLANSPNAQYYRQLREIARYETKVERSKLAPDLSIGYFNHSLVSTEGTNIYTPSDRFSGFQAGITIPIFFYPQTAKVKASKINEKIAEETYNYAISSMNSELNVRLQELLKNRNTLDYFEKNALLQAETIITQANLNYRSGNIDFMDYIQSINIAVSIKSGYLEAINNYNQIAIEIEALMGMNSNNNNQKNK